MDVNGLSFQKPPLKEVSFSIQFKPIEAMHAGLIGAAWCSFRENYPHLEEREELNHETEVFGVLNRPRVPQFRVVDKPACPRLLCLNETKTFAIQIQKDRFAFNWIYQDGNEYPRYPKLKELFRDEFRKFRQFLTEENLGDLIVDQLELTYVNWIPKEDRSIRDVVYDIPGEERHPKNISFEQLGMNLKHVISSENGERIGRLHTALSYPAEYQGSVDNILLKYVARVHPRKGEKASDAVEGFDLLRATINESFEAMTKKDMHEEWQRES